MGFRAGLRQLGYADGHNIYIEERLSGGDADRLRSYARDLVNLNVDVIVSLGTAASLAAKQATSSVPIVLLSVADPVGTGLVNSLGKPGGNVTGVSAAFEQVAPKYVELLRELMPRISRIAFLGNAKNPANTKITFPSVQTAARSLGIAVEYLSVTNSAELAQAVAAVRKSHIQGLIVSGDTTIVDHMAEITRFAADNRLPAVYFGDEYVQAGGLLSYGPTRYELGHQAATYVDKILKGATPSDLPVEQPTKFDLVLNVRTARALQIEIPKTLLFRADRVIE